jgi:tRNA nucleotidyltransferase (CCA-adding enzyme)
MNVNDSLQAARRIAQLAAERGGRAYFVGGCVRDKYIKKLQGDAQASFAEAKDLDVEVHGLEPQALWDLLQQVGDPEAFGESFGVFSLRHLGLDIAMPRKEHAVGRGHRDFAVSVDPFIGPKEASRRRDFTVNALMEDVLTGELLDPWNGLADLKAKVLRHVDDTSFPEDPLRVLRAAQFAARLGFAVAPETTALCRGIDLAALSSERVEGELKKALLQSERPSVFFETLRDMGQLGPWFAELQPLTGLAQDPVFHPEGDVWVHTMEVLDRAAARRAKAENPYGLMLLALCHDLGKITTTEVLEKDGRIHSYGHETEGVAIAAQLLERVCGEKSVRAYVYNMIPLHMRPNVTAYARPSVKSTNHLFDEAASPLDLIWFGEADRPEFAGKDEFHGDTAFLMERLQAYRETMAKSYVMGRDLIAAGLTPDESFSELLAYAHKLRLAGIEKESALKQTLAYARKREKQSAGL